MNFERDKTVKEFFDGDLNVMFISEQLSAYFKVPVIPGKTLLDIQPLVILVRRIVRLHIVL